MPRRMQMDAGASPEAGKSIKAEEEFLGGWGVYGRYRTFCTRHQYECTV